MWVPEFHPKDEAKAPPMSQFASVAQLVEQGTENPRVAGSIPAGGTTVPGGYRKVSTRGTFKIQAYVFHSFHRMETDAGVAHLVERHLAKVEVASSSLVTCSKNDNRKAFSFLLSIWRHSQVVRQSSAKAPPPVQIWVSPPKKKHLQSRCFFFGYLETGKMKNNHT